LGAAVGFDVEKDFEVGKNKRKMGKKGSDVSDHSYFTLWAHLLLKKKKPG
jgi:hypothetical protein